MVVLMSSDPPPFCSHPGLASCREQNPGRTQQECCYSRSSLLFGATTVWATILRHLNLRTVSTVADPTSPVDPERLYAPL